MKFFVLLILSPLVFAFNGRRQRVHTFQPKLAASVPVGSTAGLGFMPLADSLGLVMDGQSWVRAFDLKTKATKWWAKIDDYVSGMPLLDSSQNIVLSTQGGEVIKLDGKTGKILWRRPISGFSIKKPISSECGYFIVSTGGQFYCLNPESGQPVFRGTLPESGETLIISQTEPLNLGSSILIPSTSGQLVEVDGKTGKVLFTSTTDFSFSRFGGVVGQIVEDGAWLYFATYQGKLKKMRKSDKKLVAEVAVGSVFDLAATKNQLVISNKNSEIMALDKENLKVLWKIKVYEPILSLKLIGNTVFGIGSTGYIVALEENGKIKWDDYLETKLSPRAFKCLDSVCFTSASSNLYQYEL